MTRKQILILILAIWACTGVTALVLHLLTSGATAALLDNPAEWPHLAYALSLVCVMTTVLSCYYLLRKPQLGAWPRGILLAVPSLLAVAGYYLFLDPGLLAVLPVLAVVSGMMCLKAEI